MIIRKKTISSTLQNAILAIFLSVLLSSNLKAQIALDTLQLNQKRAIEIALEQNNRLQATRLDIEQKKANRKAQLGKLLPQFDVSANYNHTLKKQRMYFGGSDDSKNPMARMFPEDGIEIGMTHNIQAGVRASMPLIVPQLWTSLGLSRRAVEQAIEEARSSEIKLKSEVRKAYVGLLLAQEQASVLRKSLMNIHTSYAQAKEKYHRGLIAEYDLLRLETQAENLKPNLLQAEENCRLSKMKLKVLLNLELEQEISLQENIIDYEDYIYTQELASKEQEDLSNNPLLRKLDLQSKSLKTSLKVKRMSFMPSLSLNFLYNYNYANNSLELDKSKRWSPYSMIGVNLSIPLFSGGSRYYEVRGAKIQLEQLALQRLQAQRELSLALEQAQSQLQSAKEQFLAAEIAKRSATRGFTIAQARYNNGLSSLLELNDAELSLRQAQLNLSQAIYKYLLATYQIEELKGEEFN